jgi:hypothetical protein
MLHCGFWRIKPCGQTINERQQVNAQKQDGQTQTTRVVKAKPFLSHPAVLSVGKLILPNFMLTHLVSVQPKFAVNAIKKHATKDGTQDRQLIGGLQEVTSTVLLKNFWLNSLKSKMDIAPFVVKYQKPSVVCMWITAIKLELFGVFCATAATLVLGLLKIAPNSSLKQSLT